MDTLILSPTAPAPPGHLSDVPPDPRLIRSAPEGALAAGALPWARIGAATLIATDGRCVDANTRATLRRHFGPLVFGQADPVGIARACSDLAGAQLAARAECRTLARESCRDWSGSRVGAILGLLALAVIFAAIVFPKAVILALTAWALVTLLSVTGLRAAAALATWRAPPRVAPAAVAEEDLPTISLLVPLFREREIAARLIERLGGVTYPRDRLDLILVLEDDDELTRAAIRAADLPAHMRTLEVPRGTIRTKPRALNYALDFARGSIVGVYDAEDWPDPGQLRAVADTFASAPPDVACLQGRLAFYNARRNWLTRCFAIDYATWFGLILPGLLRLGFVIPLGGTTLFLRRDVLEGLGRWDAHNVTEDADLGIRLARRGYRTEFLASTTQEEATSTVRAWVRQRSRWIKGYAVTWAVHTRSPLRLLGELGWWRFLGMQILFLGSLSQFVLAPLLWSFWLVLLGVDHPFAAAASWEVMIGVTILFFLAEITTIAINAAGVAPKEDRWLVKWVPVMHLYFPLAAVASWKGLLELVTRPFYWDKTAHAGDVIGRRRRR